MTIKLRQLIQLVRQCKTAAEERQVITKESSNIRTSFKDEENQYRNRNMAKVIFMQMLGYPTAFAQMECLKLIVSNSYRDKRMGYLSLMLLLDERQEILMLVTNSLKKLVIYTNLVPSLIKQLY
jgi:AP-1 complex subunit gamma-1